ncbi:MAG: hypothetical protein V3U51_04465 [Thermoplasmata archaeon]
MEDFKNTKQTSQTRWFKIASDGETKIDDKTLSEVKEIIDKTDCPKDFRCCKSGFDVLCKARDIGLDSFLVCLDDDPPDCVFSLTYGTKYFFPNVPFASRLPGS